MSINEAIAVVRARLQAKIADGQTTLSGAARAAGLHPNALYTLDGDWNPTADTLRRLEAWLAGRPMPPKERKVEAPRPSAEAAA